MESNHRPRAYEARELPPALSRYFQGGIVHIPTLSEVLTVLRVLPIIFYPAVTATGFVQLIPQGSQGVGLLLGR